MHNAPSNLRIGGGAGGSSIHPIVLLVAIIALVLVFVLPRHKIVSVMLLMIFLTPFGQQIYVGGLHLYVNRLLILCCVVRLKFLLPRMGIGAGPNPIDKAFKGWALLAALSIILQFLQPQALVNQAGVLIDTLGDYLLLRYLIRDEEDILRVVRTLGYIVCIFAATMLVEKSRGVNPFGYVGGHLLPFIRDGAIRAQATFQGPIPAGTFAGPLLCLFILLWRSRQAKTLATVSIIGVVIMVVTSASSTPLLALAGSVLGICLWPFRNKMRMFRWGFVLFLLGAQLFMKAPVWFLINHVDLVAGNSGYHRAILIDACIRHFWDWCVIGVKSTDEWGWDLWDQANQFVAVAENGGLAAFICFVLVLKRAFSRIGTARRQAAGDPQKEWFMWLLGSCLFSHVVAFFGISYGDQTMMSWHAFLAIICAATPAAISVQARKRGASQDGIYRARALQPAQ